MIAINGGTSDRYDHQDTYQSRAQVLCRALGISIFYNLYYNIRHRGPLPGEPEKIAIDQKFKKAFWRGYVHFIPISATVVLVVLNCRGYYIGSELAGAVGQDDAKFIALQFAAKLHELAIIASLAAVIFSYIQHKLVRDHGLPFGTILAGERFKEINYLWSVELWGIARAKLRKRDKMALTLLIIVCTTLALSASPSSATLMRPRFNWWPAGGTDFWIALPQDELYSTNASSSQVSIHCMVATGDLSCPSVGWQTLAQNYMFSYSYIYRNGPLGYLPDTVQVPGAKAIRSLWATNRAPNFQFMTSMTVASVGSSSIADGLVELGRLWAWAAFFCRDELHERFWSRRDVNYSVQAWQPVVFARCLGRDDSIGGCARNATGCIDIYDLWDQGAGGDFSKTSYDYTQDERLRPLIQNFNTSNVSEVVWAKVPQSNGTGAALAAFLSVPRPQQSSLLFVCTLDARIARGRLQGTRSAPLIVTATDPLSMYGENTFRRISIEPDWAAYLNPTIPSDNSTAFQNILEAAGLLNSESFIYDDNTIAAVESLFALTVVNGLARRDYGKGFLGTLSGNTNGLDLVSNSNVSFPQESECENWSKQLLPPASQAMTYGGHAFNITECDEANGTKFTMQVHAQGYAYGTKGSAAKFAIAALLLYVSIALSQWMYSWADRRTSDSWDSIAKLVALAMRSEDRSDAFANTGAGIYSPAIFEKPSQVIYRDGRLQLAVGGSRGRYKRVKPKKDYE